MSVAALVQILVPMAVLSVVVVTLASLVLVARHWLTPSGQVSVLINGRKTLSVAAGNKLLWELAEDGIFLPAACGGRGTCGQCRVVVREGAQPLLPTEAVHIKRRDADAGVRLACMTTIQEALALEVPEEMLAAQRWLCRVESNRRVSTFLTELVLALPGDEQIDFRAGAYVLVEAPAHRVRFADFELPAQYRDDWRRYQMLDLEADCPEPTIRAYSLLNAPADKRRIVLLVRIATAPANAPGAPPGRVSSFVYSLKAGDSVAVSGAFGDFHARRNDKEMIMIAGGAGIAPIHSILLDELAQASTRRISLWYGVRNRKELCYDEDFSGLAERHDSFSYHVALSEPTVDNDWRGHTGFIHDVVHKEYLLNHEAPEDAEYYLCGPPLMSAAVLRVLDDLGVAPDSILFDDFGA